ncbi:MAG: hypothetical protein WCS27_10685 [Victivallaceae bacterium]
MKIGKRTFLKLCGTATVALMPGIKLFAAKIYNKALRGVKPRSYPGRLKMLNIKKNGKRGDWQG